MSGATIVLIAAGWFIGSIIVALILGACIPNADRDRDGEQAQREPVTERPSVILVSSNHGDMSA